MTFDFGFVYGRAAAGCWFCLSQV